MRGALRRQTPTPSRHGTQLQPVLLLSQILIYITDASLYMKVNIYWKEKKNSQALVYFSHFSKLPSEPQNIRNFILARSPPKKKRFTEISNILYTWHLIYTSRGKIIPIHSLKTAQVTCTLPPFYTYVLLKKLCSRRFYRVTYYSEGWHTGTSSSRTVKEANAETFQSSRCRAPSLPLRQQLNLKYRYFRITTT